MNKTIMLLLTILIAHGCYASKPAQTEQPKQPKQKLAQELTKKSKDELTQEFTQKFEVLEEKLIGIYSALRGLRNNDKATDEEKRQSPILGQQAEEQWAQINTLKKQIEESGMPVDDIIDEGQIQLYLPKGRGCYTRH